MKHNRHYLCAGLLCALLALTACAPSQANLSDRGLTLIDVVDTLAESEAYITVFTGNSEITDLIKDIGAQEYTAPTAVFTFANAEDLWLRLATQGVDLPDEIQTILRGKLAGVLPTQVSAMSGTEALAATSLLSYSESFLYNGLESTQTYLYTYDNGYTFMVTFVPQKDNIVNASVNAVINTDLSKCRTPEEVSAFFASAMEQDGFEVSMVNPKS